MSKSFVVATFLPIIAFAQEHGHSHGDGGEIEHLYPIIGIFVVLVLIGVGVSYFMNKKK